MGDCTQRRRPAAASRGGVSLPKKASASAISLTATSSPAAFTTNMGRAASTIFRSRSDSTAGKISIFMSVPRLRGAGAVSRAGSHTDQGSRYSLVSSALASGSLRMVSVSGSR